MSEGPSVGPSVPPSLWEFK